MVNHTKTYASLVSTLPKTISIKWRRKGGDLSPKSCCFQSKQPCANTRIRFTSNSFIAKGYGKCQTFPAFQELVDFRRRWKGNAGQNRRLPPTIRVYNLASIVGHFLPNSGRKCLVKSDLFFYLPMTISKFFKNCAKKKTSKENQNLRHWKFCKNFKRKRKWRFLNVLSSLGDISHCLLT